MAFKKLRVIISGGGTGGHIFPAISIADKLKEVNPQTEILFVGAKGKMEMQKVPAAGYEIIGLPIAGLQRKLSLANIMNNIQVPFKWLASRCKASKILKDFKPDIAIGVGGYASAPLMEQAAKKHIPTLIQEQNSYAGLTNRMLGGKVGKICVAYTGMERFFPAEKIVITGNPIRKDIVPATPETIKEGLDFYGLDPDKKHLFIVGGSLGSYTLNKSVMKWIKDGCAGGDEVEIIWQCGKYYKEEVDAFMKEAVAQGIGGKAINQVHCFDFIKRMDLAYAVSDLIISRAGASTVSELCAAHKAVIFVPSPNVAEDHQTHNAMALLNKEAAMLVKDAEAEEKLMATAIYTLKSPKKISSLENNIAALAMPNSDMAIVEQAYKILG